MTKQEFLNGKEFKVNKNSSTSFALRKSSYGDSQYIAEIAHSFTKGEVIFEQHILNIDKIGRVGFEGYTYVMGKEVKIKLRYENLID